VGWYCTLSEKYPLISPIGRRHAGHSRRTADDQHSTYHLPGVAGGDVPVWPADAVSALQLEPRPACTSLTFV
jgi:hypothetical protein